MWRWALRSFLDERASLIAGAGGVGVVFLLVLILDGAVAGESDQMVALIEHSDASVWVMQKGVANVHMAASSLGEDVAVALRRVPGVATIEPLLYGGAQARFGGDDPAVYLVGVRDGQRTRPWSMASGRDVPGRGEVVIPEVRARLGGVGLGSLVGIGGSSFRIVGLSRGTYSMANSLVFMAAADLLALHDTVADASYYLVWARPHVSGRDLAARIREAVPSVSALDRATLISNDRDLAFQMGGALVRIMTLVAALVAALVIGFTVFTFTARRARELAVAKAVGARGHHLVGAAVFQAVGLALIGESIALILAVALQPIFAVRAPGLIIHFRAIAVAQTGTAAIVVAIAAAVLPAWRVARVDPVEVFS